ncbi:MAG: type II secretion system protein N [Steroidobacteraceae bacterium]
MPASRSPRRGAEPAAHPRSPWPLILLIGIAAIVAAVAALPASIVVHFLPPTVVAGDFSGSLWHGSAGRITVDGRDAGALEWRLQPAALLGMTLSTELHWVKVGFVIDAAVTIDRHGFAARDIKGGGPIEDLVGLGVAAGWRGAADIHLDALRGSFRQPFAVGDIGAAGDIKVSNLAGAQVAGGADLGGYDLRFVQAPPGAGDSLDAQLTDTGGPLAVQTTIHYAAQERTATLSGTVRERPDAPPALLAQLQNLSQLRGRDAQGRIPVDLEFTL